jgi:arylsulfatase A-like enzyme
MQSSKRAAYVFQEAARGCIIDTSAGRNSIRENHTMNRIIATIALTLALGTSLVRPAGAQEILPFPPKPSGSMAGRTMQESIYSPLPPVNHLPKEAPNILIVLIDDVGPAQTDTFGGGIHTPTLSKIAKEGIAYNRFHTTAMCSPTRAALFTGRNHHRIANGQIAELANDWDGYMGIIPKSSATVAEILKDYGYHTGAWGKWHNTPAEHTTAAGLFEYWPTGYGFQYFYGFLGGEASQYEPQLVRNTAYVDHPHTSGGHTYYHPTTQQQIQALDALGGLDVLGSAKTDNMYHAGWAWAGSTPYQYTKLIASHFGGTRNPLAVRWPAKITPDATPRAQFLHVNDVVPTIYDLLGITPPRVVNGMPQDPFDGVSFTSTFHDAQAKEVKHTQYFEIMGSRGVYHDGWMASAFGPLIPWIPGLPKEVLAWTPDKDTWELYKLDDDWSQANDLAAKIPAVLADKKELFLIEFTKNSGLPVGGGLWVPAFHPELRAAPPYTSWTFPGAITRMPEFAAPALGNKPNMVTIDADVPANANGVLYALGGFSGGLALYVKDGILSYEYNLFEIARTHIKAKDKLPTGKVRVQVETTYVERKAAGPLQVVLKVNGKEVASGVVPISAPLGFTANDCLDFGIDLGSPVGLEYYDQAPFKFNGTIEQAHVAYTR